MATPAQAAAATVGAGSLAAAGAYGITQAVNGSAEETTEEQETNTESNQMPTDVVVFAKEEALGTEYSNNFLSLTKKDNLPHLVKTKEPNNQKWWDWAFKNKYQTKTSKTKLDDLFNNLNDSVGLKNACENAYKSDKNKYAFGDQDYLLKNISDYCTKGAVSIDISEPKAEVYGESHQATNGYTTGVLSISANAAVLVKKEAGTTNDLWWKWAYKNLYLTTTENIDTLFTKTTKVTAGYHQDTTTALNHVCDSAYKSNYAALKTTENKLLKNIKQFCSIDRTTTLLKLPEPVVENGNLLTSSTSNYSTNELVKANTQKLVDPTKETDWWNWIYENVYLPFKSKANPPLKAPFAGETIKKGYEEINGAGTSGGSTSLNKACKEAYSKSKSELETKSDTKSLLNQVKEFCAPSSKAPLEEPAQ